MFLSIHLNNLRNSEFIQFFNDILSIYNKCDTQTLGVKVQVDTLEHLIVRLQKGFGKKRASNISEELAEIDARRDNCITAIRNITESYVLHYNKNTAHAANKLLQKIDSFGPSIARQNYQAETSIINKLSHSFNTEPELQKALNLLHLKEWAEQLKKENKLFNLRFLDRINEEAQDNNENFLALRIEVTGHYRTLCNHITAHATLKGKEAYLPIIDPINSLIENYNTTLKRRSQKLDEVNITKSEESVTE